jgi:3-oxoacyl-[acyl-carrier protein] reductase
MYLGLTGKVVLISGSSKGIGRGIADVLLEENCTVFINGRDENSLNETYEDFCSKYTSGNVFKICSDLTITSKIRESLDVIVKKTGKGPEIVVANIGSGRSEAGWDVADDEWERMFSLNFFGAIRLSRESIRHMKESKCGGNIIIISSIAGCEALPAPLPYSSSKAALLNFVKNTADLVSKYNIRINAVSPGNVLFDNGTWDNKIKNSREGVLDYIKNSVPMNSFASPDDIGNMVAYLVSKKAGFITGSNFIVDGGQVRKYI